MIENITSNDERRVHRVTTYFSDREVQIIKDAFERSTIDNYIEYVNKVDKAAWMLAHFFKGDIQRKQVIQNMAYIILSSGDLIEMAATMIAEEDFQS